MSFLHRIIRMLVEPATCPPPVTVKRCRMGTFADLLKPEKARTYDALTLRALTINAQSVKSLERYMAHYGAYPNDVGASLRRVRRKLRSVGIKLQECDVKPARGVKHKKHLLMPDDRKRVQAMLTESNPNGSPAQ